MSPTIDEEVMAKPGRVPYDIIGIGVVMMLSGFMDTYIIFANPDYRLPVFGVKVQGIAGWYLNLLYPVVHLIIGYGTIRARKWGHRLFVAFTLYGILSATVNLFRLPPPHNIRTVFLVVSVAVLAYLYLRRKHFSPYLDPNRSL